MGAMRVRLARLVCVSSASALLIAVCLPGIAMAPPTPKCDGLTRTVNDTTDPIDGTSGNDVLVGTDNSETINGNGGNDVICGKGGADQINGGAGNDVLYGNTGDDSFDGGADTDAVAFHDVTNDTMSTGVTASFASNVSYDGYASTTEELTGVEQLWGSAYADSLSGTSGNESFFGDAGSDTVDGGSGSGDTLLLGVARHVAGWPDVSIKALNI